MMKTKIMWFENHTHMKDVSTTVNVEILAQYIFSHISRSVLGARKYDVNEKLNHYSANGSNC